MTDQLPRKTIGKNQEQGFLKWCPECRRMSGHFFYPNHDEQKEQCLKCGTVKERHIFMPFLEGVDAPLTMHDDMTLRHLDASVFYQMDPEEYLWVWAAVYRRKVKLAVREKLQLLKVKRLEAGLAPTAPAAGPTTTEFGRI